MRDIKFRAWDSVNNKWLLGYEHERLGGFSMFGEVMALGEYCNMLSSFKMEDWHKIKLMQFTELTDENGKDIYEGDILKSFGSDVYSVIYVSDLGSYFLQYYDKTLEEMDMMRLNINTVKNLKIIGNIYENPNLL